MSAYVCACTRAHSSVCALCLRGFWLLLNLFFGGMLLCVRGFGYCRCLSLSVSIVLLLPPSPSLLPLNYYMKHSFFWFFVIHRRMPDFPAGQNVVRTQKPCARTHWRTTMRLTNTVGCRAFALGPALICKRIAHVIFGGYIVCILFSPLSPMDPLLLWPGSINGWCGGGGFHLTDLRETKCHRRCVVMRAQIMCA